MPKLLSFKILILIYCFVGLYDKSLAQNKTVSLEDVFKFYRFIPQSTGVFKWMKDDNYYTNYTEQEGLVKISVINPSEKITLCPAKTFLNEKGQPLQVEDYVFSEKEDGLLLFTNTTPIYRHSSKQKVYFYNFTTKKTTPIFEGKFIQLAEFSPDGKNVSFVFENNLYYQNVNANTVTQVTKDGVINQIINGATDWVYEEEFSLTRGYSWSPDGNYIAYYRFDERNVPEFSMTKYGTLYPTITKFKYPKAGDPNALVQLYVYDLQNNTSNEVNLGPDKDLYLPRIKWTPKNQLGFMVMNRLQNKLQISLYNPINQSVKEIYSETSTTYIDEVSDNSWFFLTKSDEMIILSDKTNFMHLHKVNLENKTVTPITSGNYDVTEVIGIDETNNLIFFQSTEINSTERYTYKINLSGQNKTLLTPETGSHSTNFSTNFKYAVDEVSAWNMPSQSKIINQNGETIRYLNLNENLKKVISEYEISPKLFFKIPSSEGDSLNAWMIKPSKVKGKRKHPLLMYVYGGPGSQTVRNSYDPTNFYWYQYLANRGYTIVSVDGRGTGGKGSFFKKVTYKQLGKLEAEDQAEAARYLSQKFNFIDPARIGIWGWSFGGYLSTLVAVKNPTVFKCVIAVAPVTSWRFYDTIYTERYLQTPQLNAKGYDENSPITHAANMKANYFIIHGTADDNVHFQNTMDLTTALVKAGIQFRQFSYPDKHHGISGGNTRLHLYTMITQFLLEQL